MPAKFQRCVLGNNGGVRGQSLPGPLLYIYIYIYIYIERERERERERLLKVKENKKKTCWPFRRTKIIKFGDFS